MRHQQFHILDLLTWTIIIAVLCASYMLAPLIDPPNNRSIRAILRFCVIASVPFAFIISLIRQPIFSSRMWTSFLFTVLVSSWLGFLLSEMLIMQTNCFQGMGALVAASMGMILSLICSVLIPCFFSSLRFKIG